MAKDLSISMLLDFYGDMLTEKQKEVIELYYNEDLSLGEIAQHSGITRQGVRDSIKRGEAILLDVEERLGLVKRFHRIEQDIRNIIERAKEIEYQADRYGSTGAIIQNAREIVTLAIQIEQNG